MKLLYIALLTFMFALCFAPLKSVAQDENTEQQLAQLVDKMQEYYQTDTEKCLSFAKQAEILANKSNNLAYQALVYTWLGNIYGLKENRSDKAADYHQQAFLIYNDLFGQHQISAQFFYDFFDKNVAPIYELISSEAYRRRRRDKKALHKYQELYTELSRFFLNKEIMNRSTQKNINAKNMVLIGFDKHQVITENTPKKIQYEVLTYQLTALYLSYINELEQALGQKGADLQNIRKIFLRKKQQIQAEIDFLNLSIIAKDSIKLKDSLLAMQKIKTMLAYQKTANAEFKLKTAQYYQNISLLLLLLTFSGIALAGIWMRYHQSKKQKEHIKNKNQSLTQMNQELEQFAHKVSHDLRSPLASVMGLLYIAKHEKDSTQLNTYFTMMEKSLTKLNEFIEDILTHAKNASAKVKIEKINLKPLLEEAIQQHQYSNQDRQLNIKLDIQEENSQIYTDKHCLNLALNNLISNAFRYSDSNKMSSFLEISAQIKAKETHLSFKDNGVGIPSEHTPKIFDRFYRANEQEKGSGLGLYIVKQGIEKLGGSIKVSSQEGIGTQFDIHIPNNEASKA